MDLKHHKLRKTPEVSQTTDVPPALEKFYYKHPELKVMHSLVKNLEVPKIDAFIKPSAWNLGRTVDMIELILANFCEEHSSLVRRRRLNKAAGLDLRMFVSKFFLEETSKTRHQCERVRSYFRF